MAPRLYTIGTWRVSLDAYLQQLRALKVACLVDVRGNPQAGRQQELKRSKAFEAALSSVGVRYEYWGKELGEDCFDLTPKASHAAVTELVAATRKETICLMGHLHEPQGCHRLQLSGMLAAEDIEVMHLLWVGHDDVKKFSHAEVAAKAAEVESFFYLHLEEAEGRRKARPEAEVATGVKRTPLVNIPWEEFKPSLFQDGRAYRFELPFETELLWYPAWLDKEKADDLEATVRKEVTFYHPTYVFQEPEGGFTKTLIKRGQARICDKVCPGSVGSMPLQPWSEKLLRGVEDAAGVAFNCFVANHYADGQVVINWHSDSGPGDDEGLGPNPQIGSLSLGAVRTFSLKSKRPGPQGRMIHLDMPLAHGSFLVMGKNSQTHWLHSLPRDEEVKEERINLTFRFYARQDTKHIEGVEHNHEWETAAGSTRVLLHRDELGAGRPVLVDIPDDLSVSQLPRYLSTVLPRWRRGPVDVCARKTAEAWGSPLAPSEAAAMAAKAGASDSSKPAELRLAPRTRTGENSYAACSKGKGTAPGRGYAWEKGGGEKTKGKGKQQRSSADRGGGTGRGTQRAAVPADAPTNGDTAVVNRWTRKLVGT